MPKHTFSTKNIEEIRRHRELQSKSGLTTEAYCKRENISPSSCPAICSCSSTATMTG